LFSQREVRTDPFRAMVRSVRSDFRAPVSCPVSWTTTLAATTMAHFTDCSLGTGSADGSLLRFTFAGLWVPVYRVLDSVSVATFHSPQADLFYGERSCFPKRETRGTGILYLRPRESIGCKPAHTNP